MHSDYDDDAHIAAEVAGGRHREVIGGLWDEVGQLQLEFLQKQGLKPGSRLLDIGCGSLRLGARAANYLEPCNYFGTDISESLLDAGWARELSPEGQIKLPRRNLSVSPDFDFDFLTEPMDFGIAQSVFTHLPLNHLRRCLTKAAPKFRTGGKLFVTAFIRRPSEDLSLPLTTLPGGVVTYDWRDPYHYWPTDFRYAATYSPWEVHILGDWGHPRGQQMVLFERL
jgi:SAM-dependent methyltransferase